MTPLGRPPKGAQLVDQIDGSDQARRKLRIIIQTLSGQKSVPVACAELGIARSRFHAMRKAFLLDAVSSLEPRSRGRPARQMTAEQIRVGELQRQVQALSLEVRAAQIREELAAVMPHLLTSSRRTPGNKRKARHPNEKIRRSTKKSSSAPPTPGMKN